MTPHHRGDAEEGEHVQLTEGAVGDRARPARVGIAAGDGRDPDGQDRPAAPSHQEQPQQEGESKGQMGRAAHLAGAEPALGGGPRRAHPLVGVRPALEVRRVVVQVGPHLDRDGRDQRGHGGRHRQPLGLGHRQSDPGRHGRDGEEQGLGPRGGQPEAQPRGVGPPVGGRQGPCPGVEPFLHGRRGNLPKSGGRRSRKASRPSWASAVV